MSGIFVFTAANALAQANLAKSIQLPVSNGAISETFSPSEYAQLESMRKVVGGLYAWGAIPTDTNQNTWEKMRRGDYVFCVYNKTYQYVSRLLASYRNPAFAEKVWGLDGDGKTWELMYFLSRPYAINEHLDEWRILRNGQYLGFTGISDDKLDDVRSSYGSVDDFVRKMVGDKVFESISAPF